MLNSFFSHFYLSLLFNFKIRRSIGLSCLVSSMFINIILTICIIKTTCFDNAVLIAELEGKVLETGKLEVGGHFLLITSPILVTFTRVLVHIFRKVRSTSTSKNFYCCSYIFGIITHLLMDK